MAYPEGGDVSIPFPGASGNLDAGGGRLAGFSAREVSGSASAVFRIRDGGIAGNILSTVSLAPAESRDEDYNRGRGYTDVLYFELVSGAVAGSAFVM